MFTTGTKVSLNERLGKSNYPELTAKEYTVEFCFMFDSMTYVVFQELPDMVFNRYAFDYTDTSKKCIRTLGFAVKTSQGGYLITDLKHLDRLEGLGKVFGVKEIQSMGEVFDYFNHCATCDREVTEEERYGILKRGDLCTLVICPECCTTTPDINPFFPEPDPNEH